MTSGEDKQLILSLVEEGNQKGARKTKICEVLGIPTRTIQRWKKNITDMRPLIPKNPKNKLTSEERNEIIDICCKPKYVDKSPKEIVPILAENGIYIASESTMYRILREEAMLNHRENTKRPQKRHKTEELKATGPNQVWSWDITYIKTAVKGLFFYLYMFMDVWSRKIVAWDMFEEQTSENAKYVIEHVSEDINVKEIHLHSDNGSPMKGATFLATLQGLGIIPSFSRPSVSNDNAYSESLFKTLKYSVKYPGKFETIEEGKEWLKNFVDWYNNEHRHSGIKYVTPNQRHNGEDKEILKQRNETYLKAMKKNPERWIRREMRDWTWKEEVLLNPDNEKTKKIA